MRSAWVLCLVAMASPASAQSAREEADALFERGKELMAQKAFAEACAAFERSYRIEPSISTLLNHADCREKNLQLATAWRLFSEAKHQTDAQSDATFKQLHAVAATRAGKLEPRLSRLSIDVVPEHQLAGIEILRDADRVAPVVWSQPQPIDGGTYRITARAPGRTEWSATITVKSEGDTQKVAIPKLAPVSAARPQADEHAPVSSGPASGVTPPTRTEPSQRLTARTTSSSLNSPIADGVPKRSLALTIVMGSTALALGGAAVAFSRWGDIIYADAEREPDDARQEALWKSANTRRYAAIGFAAGAASAVGAAVYLYLRGGRESAPPLARRSIHLEPITSARTMGLGLRGSW